MAEVDPLERPEYNERDLSAGTQARLPAGLPQAGFDVLPGVRVIFASPVLKR